MSDFITHTKRMVIFVGFITWDISSFSQPGVQAICEFTQSKTDSNYMAGRTSQKTVAFGTE